MPVRRSLNSRFPVLNVVETGRHIRAMRKQSGVRVKDLQRILGLTSPQSIYKWQRGDCLPTVDNLVILAAVFGTTVDEILVVDWKDIRTRRNR